ncbi:uncharacterized protein LOC132180675 [Corylus avellana]|uniref:uncharacterized protein LOC132180675 n=1 Tax=Corylus avellana TaxID=13451 RepID=UPI002869FC71|nr:uncharacterized protein LOC132180675 [Corylus avellana]
MAAKSKGALEKIGHRNSKFFHACASQRRRVNLISNIWDEEGNNFRTPDEIEGVFVRYFQKIFTLSTPSGMETCLQNITSRVSQEMNKNLLQEFTSEEVLLALQQMAPLKSLGPEGLPACFFQENWEIVGDEVLANRLKLILPMIISQNQSAFIPGRLVLDNTLAAYETLHTMYCRMWGNVGYMAIKLDMNKAYDQVEWYFLENVMIKMGFDRRWVNIIMTCISSIRYAIIVNGNPVGDIRPSRGMRQGDPLSLYLFLLSAEVLSSQLHQAASEGILTGVPTSLRGPRLNHLFFANDSLLFCKATEADWRKANPVFGSSKVLKTGFVKGCLIGRPSFSFRRLSQSPDSLVGKIIKGKYYHQGSFLEANLGSRPSFAWRSIMAARELFKEGVLWHIGDGKSVAIWKDRWILMPITHCIQTPCMTLNEDATVNELFESTMGGWNWALINEIFEEEEDEIICNIPRSKYGRPDKLIWRASPTGIFTVRSAYHMEMERKMMQSGMGSTQLGCSFLWKFLWSTQIPNSSKVFL